MKRLFVAIFLISMLSPVLGFALDRSSNDIFEQEAYDFVKKSCHNLSYESSDYFTDRVSKLTLDLGINTINKEFIDLKDTDHFGISQKLNRMLSTFSYYEGLRECFPQSESARNIYTMKLIALDLAGTLDAVILGVGGGLVITKGIAKITTLGMRKMGLSTLANWKKRALLAGVTTPLFAHSAYSAFDYNNGKKRAEAIHQSTDENNLNNMKKRWTKYHLVNERLRAAMETSDTNQIEVLKMISQSIHGELQFYCEELPSIQVRNNIYSDLSKECANFK